MLGPNTQDTESMALFVEIEVWDHDVVAWTVWHSTNRVRGPDVDLVLQQAIDAGYDDVRASVYNTGSVDD